MPETGHKFARDGLYMTEAEGLSLRGIEKGLVDDNSTKSFFTQTLNSSQVLLHSVVHLLLTLRCLS